MKSRFKQLGKDSIIYGFGGVFAKGIGFFLLPLYTRIFSPADYGNIEMLVVINGFLGSLLMMGMDSAQSFYFFEQKEAGKPAQARVITAILQWRLSWGVLIIVAAMLLSPQINTLFFNEQLSWEYFAVSFVGVLFAQLMNQSAGIFRLLYRPWSFIVITLSNTVVSAATTITLIVWLDWGVLGYFIGFGAGSLVAAVGGLWAIRTYLDWSEWHRNWWPRLIRFGAPFVPMALLMYFLNTADRWFLVRYHGQEALGMYAVGAKFATLFTLIVTTFRQAWWPVAMDAIHSPDGPQLFRIMGRLYLGVGSAAIVLVTFISPYLIKWLTAPSYHAAYPIIGVLAWQAVFFGFYLIAAAGIWKEEETGWAPVSIGIAVIVNLILAIWLVPKFAGMGAAAATSISFLVWNIITLWISERFWPVRYPIVIFGLQIGIGVTAVTGILFLYAQGQEIWKIGIVTIFAMIIIIAITLEQTHVKWAIKQIINRYSLWQLRRRND